MKLCWTRRRNPYLGVWLGYWFGDYLFPIGVVNRDLQMANETGWLTHVDEADVRIEKVGAVRSQAGLGTWGLGPSQKRRSPRRTRKSASGRGLKVPFSYLSLVMITGRPGLIWRHAFCKSSQSEPVYSGRRNPKLWLIYIDGIREDISITVCAG
ncbi:hypothetical protein F4782DRAFT_520783 [Xylaria castorea]|nr:hypothetical protein F4782DRAFT_520783 [Xylaria castorea]